MENNLFAVKDKKNLCKKRNYIIMTPDGLSIYSNETKDDFVEQGYEILTYAEFNELWDQCWAEYEKELCGKWKEISPKRYDDMLNCLPPMQWTNGGFFLSELYDGDIGYFFQEWLGKYYESMQNIHTQRSDILNELQAHIRSGDIKPLEGAEV